MSKQGAKPRASEPARPSATPPPTQRKASGLVGKPGSKFYTGPTVPSPNAVKIKAQQVGEKGVSAAKLHGKKAIRTVKRHPYSFASLLTSIPFLILLSLTSTVLCPPPTRAASWFHFGSSPTPLRQTLCTPAYLYHDRVLEPFVYPKIESARTFIEEQPFYQQAVIPSYERTSTLAKSVWERPIRPILIRLQKGARRVYASYIAPRLPYLRKRFNTVAGPHIAKINAAYQKHVIPHIATGQKYANAGAQSARSTYGTVSTHPATIRAGKLAQRGYKEGQRRSYDAYTWTRPRVVRLARELERQWRETVFPRLVRGAKYSLDRLDKGTAAARALIAKQYKTHLDPHLGPHIAVIRKALAPYITILNERIYRPYILPTAVYYFPSLAEKQKPRSFWQMVSDFLPSPGLHAAEQKGKMYEDVKAVKKDVKSVTKSANVKSSTSSVKSVASSSATKVTREVKSSVSAATQSVVSAASSVASAAKESVQTAAGKVEKAESKMTRSEMERVLDHLQKRLETAGKAGEKAAIQAIVNAHDAFITETIPRMKETNKGELQKDIDYTLGGLDKLYMSSSTLTADQVDKSGKQAEGRVYKKHQTIRARGRSVQKVIADQSRPGIKDAGDAIDYALGKEARELEVKMAGVDGVSDKDWTRYHNLHKRAEAYKSSYERLREGQQTDKTIQAASLKLMSAVNELSADLDEIFEVFRERVRMLQKEALAKISAREMVQSSSSKRSSASSVAHTAKGERATILPVTSAGGKSGAASAVPAADIGEGDVIGKGKEQVMDAMSQILSSAARGETQKDMPASVVASAASRVSDASRSAMRAAGITGLPEKEKAKQSVESVVGEAKSAVVNTALSVGEIVQSAATTASTAVADVAESATSVVNGASQSVSSVAGTVSAVVDDASVKASALGESVESAAKPVVESASSVYTEASETVTSVGQEVTDAVREALGRVHAATEGVKRRQDEL